MSVTVVSAGDPGGSPGRQEAADRAPGRFRSAALPRRVLVAGRLVGRSAPLVLSGYAVLTLTTGVLPVASAWLTKTIIDGLTTGRPWSALALSAGALLVVGVVLGVTPHVTTFLRGELDRRVGTSAQRNLFTTVNGFVGLARFENPRFLDRLRLAQQTAGLSPHPNRAVDGALGICRAVFTVSGFLGTLFLLSPLMTVLVLAAGAPTVAAQLMLSRQRARMLWDIGTAERREFFYRQLLSTVEAAKEVRLFGLGTFFRDRMLDDRRAVNAAKRSVDRRQALVQSGLALLATVVSGGGLLWAVHAAGSGRLTVGDVTVFVAAVAGVQAALTTFAGDFARMHQSLLLFDHFLVVESAAPELPVSPTPRPLPPLRKGIDFEDVWFRYSEDHSYVLRGLNLHIPYGGALALVGLNGAGKSTVVKLLCRFYDPTRGRILWDGVDIREFAPEELRRRIGAVFQDYMKYDMTAAENIALGDLTALGDEERITDAAVRAGIHDKLTKLPHGYHTLLSRMFARQETAPDAEDPKTGVILSGGQWQRLALARAFLRDQRDLMILDEPAAGLDAEAEFEIHTALKQHRTGRTSLLISHRLGAIRDADRIAVIGDGTVVEEGDHRSLMEADGEYARLFRLQASGYESTDGPSDAIVVSSRSLRTVLRPPV